MGKELIFSPFQTQDYFFQVNFVDGNKGQVRRDLDIITLKREFIGVWSGFGSGEWE